MSAFLFYEPTGSANRYSNKERFRARPNPQVHVPVNRDLVGISEPTSESSYGMMDTANKTLQTLPLERAFQQETSSCTSAIGDDCFDEAQMSDGGDSLHSLFSDFTDDRLGDADHNSVNGLAPVKHLPNATVSHGATHHDANPAPSEFGSFGQSQPVAGSAPFAVGCRQHGSPDHIDARLAFSPTCMPPIRNFTEIDSVTFADPIHNDLAIIDPVDTTYTEAGTQTDHPDVTLSDRETQTDQYGTEATNSKEGRPFSVLVQTRETPDISYEQHDEHVGNQRHGNATDSIETSHQNIPDLVPTVSDRPHYPVTRPVVDATHRGHPLPIHGFFTIHGNIDQLAYTLTFFEPKTEFLSESTDGRTSSLARNDAIERLSTVPGLTVHGNDDDKDLPMFDPSLNTDEKSWSPSRDESVTQDCYVSNGRKGDPFLPEDDALLVRLKGNHLPWKTIATFFPGRSEGSLQNRFCTKLKRRLPESGRDQKRARTAGLRHLDEDASQQLQCELDWIAGDRSR